MPSSSSGSAGNPIARSRVEPLLELRAREPHRSGKHGSDPAGDRAVGRAPPNAMISTTLVQAPGQQERCGIVATQNRDLAAEYGQ